MKDQKKATGWQMTRKVFKDLAEIYRTSHKESRADNSSSQNRFKNFLSFFTALGMSLAIAIGILSLTLVDFTLYEVKSIKRFLLRA
jgi:hypothetical protein